MRTDVRKLMVAGLAAVKVAASVAFAGRYGWTGDELYYLAMFGWPDMAHEVAAAYAALPPSDRRVAMVLAAHDSQAGALDLYGPALGLPTVVSPHLTDYYWAPARMDPRVVVAVGYSRSDLEALFADVSQVGTISNAYGIANNDAGPAPVAGVAVAQGAGLIPPR